MGETLARVTPLYELPLSHELRITFEILIIKGRNETNSLENNNKFIKYESLTDDVSL